MSKIVNRVKTFKKHENAPTGTHKKSQKYLQDLQMNTEVKKSL